MTVTINFQNYTVKELEQLYKLIPYENNEQFYAEFEKEVKRRYEKGEITVPTTDIPTDWDIFVDCCI